MSRAHHFSIERVVGYGIGVFYFAPVQTLWKDPQECTFPICGILKVCCVAGSTQTCSMGSQCSLVPNGTRNGQFRASSSTTQCDLLPTMNCTVTLSFRNVSMRRHLVKFAATVAANLVQTLAWNQNPNCSLFDPIEEFAPSVARDFS